MDPDNQLQIKKIVENSDGDVGPDNIVVFLGASDIEGALISAETVTTGDPSFSGPLAGVSLRLPVYHILEPEVRTVIPEDVYEKNVGIWALAIDQEQIGVQFKAVREQANQDS